jgi:hypothetical protein
LIEADKRIRNIFKDIDSEDRAGGCGSSPQGIERRRDGRDNLGIAHSLNQCFHYFDKYENLAIEENEIIIAQSKVILSFLSSPEVLYDYFLSSIKLTHATVASGVFGADMQVSLSNDGPVTFLLEC